jgi:hypothetical protein
MLKGYSPGGSVVTRRRYGAESRFREALDIDRRYLREGHPKTARAQIALAAAGHRRNLRSLRALPTTDTELKLIAAAAIMGLNKMPKNGYRTPAARGTPRVL